MHRAPRKSRTLIRIQVEFQGISEDVSIKGKGYTLDLNINGCRIESATSVPRGSYVRLRLAIPKAPHPVLIGMARVRWVQAGSFGVEFIQRSAEDLPYISQATSESTRHVAAQALQPKPGKAPCTVLVVEDDPDVLHLCARTLEDVGCKVLKASGSSEALQVCTTNGGTIHLLLVDLVLRPPVLQLMSGHEQYPRVHGCDLIEHILRIRKKCHVVFMSGHDEAALRTLGIEVGGALCLQKPFSREDLLMAINQAMAGPPMVSKVLHPGTVKRAVNAR
jgi:CheY-like chemotaxis protein